MSVAIDEKGLRQKSGPAEGITDRVVAEENRVIHSQLAHKSGDLMFHTLVVHRNADYFQSLWLVLLVKFDEPGHLDATRPTIGRPKV